MSNVLNCPHCGGLSVSHSIGPHVSVLVNFTIDYKGGGFVECTACGACISGNTEEEAISKWNRRVDNTKPVGKWKIVEENEDSTLCECPSCKEWRMLYGEGYIPKYCPDCGVRLEI